MTWITAWIEPNGTTHEFDANGHKSFALDYLKSKDIIENRKPMEELLNMGWMRVTNRSETEFCIIPEGKKWSRHQERAYVDLCLKYDRTVTGI